MVSTRSDFHIESHQPTYILIRDMNFGNVSVTNDAENVCKILYMNFGDKKVYYYDSEGDFAELVHDHGNFREFKFVEPAAVLV